MQAELGAQDFRQRAARAFREQRVFAAQLHARRVAVLVMAVLGHAHIAGDHAFDDIVFHDQVMRGKAGIDFHAQAFRLLAQPFAEVGQADDVIAAIAHQRRKQDMGNGQRGPFGKKAEAVIGDVGLDRGALVFPVRDQLAQRFGIDHRAGQDMRPDLGAFFQDTNGDCHVQLLQPDRRRQPRRAAAHDDHVIVHAFAGWGCLGLGHESPCCRRLF